VPAAADRHELASVVDATSANILDAHAPRRIDENRHDGITSIDIDRPRNRPQEEDEKQEASPTAAQPAPCAGLA
jgi:hypothetical protein